MNHRDATPPPGPAAGPAFRADRDLSGALRGEWLALRADLCAGGDAAARALHSLRAATAVEDDPALAAATDRAEQLLGSAQVPVGGWEARLEGLAGGTRVAEALRFAAEALGVAAGEADAAAEEEEDSASAICA